jgi:peptide methionine sulfoxide reductase MsrB
MHAYRHVQKNLRWDCDRDEADKIANFNRHYAEHSGYFSTRQNFLKDASKYDKMTFYDSNTGNELFEVGGSTNKRSIKDFLEESRKHGWPSFRDDEVKWGNVRVLKNGETVSKDGTHLGHNLPDEKGSRYCINLVCIAGRPDSE